MVMKQLSESTLTQLRELLGQMYDTTLKLDEIMQQEVAAIRVLDGDTIIRLADEHIMIHERLATLEQMCKTLLAREGVAADMPLQEAIELYAADQAADLQALRLKLREKVEATELTSEETRMRMLAAYNVSSNVLQLLGLTQSEQTYGRSAG